MKREEFVQRQVPFLIKMEEHHVFDKIRYILVEEYLRRDSIEKIFFKIQIPFLGENSNQVSVSSSRMVQIKKEFSKLNRNLFNLNYKSVNRITRRIRYLKFNEVIKSKKYR